MDNEAPGRRQELRPLHEELLVLAWVDMRKEVKANDNVETEGGLRGPLAQHRSHLMWAPNVGLADHRGRVAEDLAEVARCVKLHRC